MRVLGVDIFAHSAAFMAFVNEADKVIPITVAGAVNALKAAYAEPSVKRFVLTSSSAAAVGVLESAITVTEESFNTKAIERAWSGPPYEPARPLINYEASKTEAEQAVWKFHKENRSRRPDLVVNAGKLQSVPLTGSLVTHGVCY
jgi:nucleoside-diphosphate-sugar epimerase